MQIRQGLTFDEFSISSLSSADSRSEERCKCKRDCGIIPQTGISAPSRHSIIFQIAVFQRDKDFLWLADLKQPREPAKDG